MFRIIFLLLFFTKFAVSKPITVAVHESIYWCIKKELSNFKPTIIIKGFNNSNLFILLQKNDLDIIIGLDDYHLNNPQIQQIADKLPLNLFEKLDIPFDWHSRIAIPFAYMYVAFLGCNKNDNSLENFINNLNDKSIIMLDPRLSMLGRIGLLWLYFENSELIKSVHPKVFCYVKGWSSAFALFSQQTNAIMLGYTTSEIYYKKNNITGIEWLKFPDSVYPIRVFTVVKVKKTFNHPDVDQVLKKLLSIPVQSTVLKNYMYPVVKIKLPESFEQCIPKKKSILRYNKKLHNHVLSNWFLSGIA